MSRTHKHRVSVTVKVDFGYYDEIGMDSRMPDRIMTKNELIKQLKKEFREEGAGNFIRNCTNQVKAELVKVKVLKYDK
jgi:hypothetical protein